MWLLCSEITVVNSTDVSVRETNYKAVNPALWQKIFLNPALLDILFWDKISG